LKLILSHSLHIYIYLDIFFAKCPSKYIVAQLSSVSLDVGDKELYSRVSKFTESVMSSSSSN